MMMMIIRKKPCTLYTFIHSTHTCIDRYIICKKKKSMPMSRPLYWLNIYKNRYTLTHIPYIHTHTHPNNLAKHYYCTHTHILYTIIKKTIYPSSSASSLLLGCWMNLTLRSMCAYVYISI